MAIITTISLSKEHAEMIKRDNLKLSWLVRKMLDEYSQVQSGELMETTASLSKKIERLTQHIQGYCDFLNERGLMNEFLEKSESK